MFKQINLDSRLRINSDILNTSLGKSDIIVINKFDNNTVNNVYEAFGIAHSIKQDIIPVQINTFGGSTYHLLALIGLFKQSTIPIATVVNGTAQSAGSVLFAFGTDGYRFIAPDSNLMIHDVAGWSEGKVEEIKSDAAEKDRVNKQVYQMMAKQCGKSKDYFLDLIHEHSHADWFLDADEALKHNIANEIKSPIFQIDITVKYSIN